MLILVSKQLFLTLSTRTFRNFRRWI